jgi:DNA-directed RNA polymerase subunit RPC12/RpoP
MSSTKYRCGECYSSFTLHDIDTVGERTVALIECPHCCEITGIMTYRSNICYDGMVHTEDPTSSRDAYQKWVSESKSDNPLLIPVLS